MPGEATVTIRDKQWVVSLATTPAELSQGLGGVASIPAGTGMLFDLGVDQVIEVTTEPMLFSLDIVWIHSTQGVVEVARDVAPGYLVTPTAAARYFLEVNAGEAEDVAVGDSVSIDISAAPGGTDWIQGIVGPVVVLGALGMVMRGFMGSGERRLGNPRTEAERREKHKSLYGASEPPPRGTGKGREISAVSSQEIPLHHSPPFTFDELMNLEKYMDLGGKLAKGVREYFGGEER